MALSSNDIHVLEQIVAADGKCLDSKRCQMCPFRAMCLSEFLNTNPPSTQQRKTMALDVLSHWVLIDDNIIVEEYKWEQR